MARVADRGLRLSVELRQRPRRMRRTPALRSLVRETRLDAHALIAPLFVISGRGREEPIASLPGHSRLSPDFALRRARDLAGLGVGGVLLFGIPDAKDGQGHGAADPEGPVPATLRQIREAGVDLVLAADVCLCEYTSHGHCGVLAGREVDNDATLQLLADAAVAYADAGADILAPSAMMDGQVAALRGALDSSGHQVAAIMAYSSKAASALYGPFREAAGSAPAFGDRKAYQMDYANGREAIREMELDADEGADVLMVKPAITSLDLLARARDLYQRAAGRVSGERRSSHDRSGVAAWLGRAQARRARDADRYFARRRRRDHHLLRRGGRSMAFVIVQPCVGVKDASCVEVCPVDCIHTDDTAEQYFIDPGECIDCGACVDPCPVNAIFPEDEVPQEWSAFIKVNSDFFAARGS